MSLGGGKSAALEQAVANSIADGVTYAVAAGNETEDACTGSPSGLAAAITVGATTNTDARASFSDFGPCVDFFAPGSNITSASFLTDTGTATMSGTSMAAPHVAGAAALYLQGAPGSTPQQVRDGLFNLTTKNIVTDARARTRTCSSRTSSARTARGSRLGRLPDREYDRSERGVAQPGSALALGARGRRFESGRPDLLAQDRHPPGGGRRSREDP